MELFWVKEAQIQGNMSSLSAGFEITDTGLHYMQNAAMQIHYRPFNSHVFSNSRTAAFHARLDGVDDTDFFWRKMLNTLMIRFIHWFPELLA